MHKSESGLTGKPVGPTHVLTVVLDLPLLVTAPLRVTVACQGLCLSCAAIDHVSIADAIVEGVSSQSAS